MKKSIIVKVKPNSRKRQVKESEEGLIVYLTSVPEKGRANEELIEIISGYFGVAKSKINIKRGHTSRIKLIEIDMV